MFGSGTHYLKFNGFRFRFRFDFSFEFAEFVLLSDRVLLRVSTLRRRSFSTIAAGEELESESESGESDAQVACWILDGGRTPIASRMSIC